MVKDFPGEKWKKVQFDFSYTNTFKLEISNYGRLKSFNGLPDGKIINGAMINGYRIIRLKLFKPRKEKTQEKITLLQKQFSDISKEIRILTKQDTDKKVIAVKEDLLKLLRRQLNKVYKEDNKYRTINYHSLIHRLVAEYFLPVPPPDKTVVAHLDFNKLYNHVENLRWMTREENFQHQQKSPYVIKEKQQRESGIRTNGKVAKLTVTKVMLLKKLLNQNKPVRQLIKQFKVTDMQIYRIKRGENWKHIPAAN